MNALLRPSPLSGRIPAIPSKSDAHRLTICAALADGPTKLLLSRTSEDICATVGCLKALGAKADFENGVLAVSPISAPAKDPLLDCVESGSTLRFLLPVAAVLCGGARFTGGGRLPERPIGELMDAMRLHGVSFSAEKLPFRTSGRLTGGEYRLKGDVSSQYVTGLLFALPLLEKDSDLVLTTRLESAAYVDITLHALSRFGIKIDSRGGGYFITGGQKYHSPGRVAVEGDWSNAAFFLAAGAIGNGVTVEGLNENSPQGDRLIIPLLRRFGADVTFSESAATAKHSRLRGCTVDIGGTPDLLPALAAVAVFAGGETRFVNAARLRLKESDRIASVAAMVRSLGGKAEELPDGLVITGSDCLPGGQADSFRDHRIVMAAAVIATRCMGEVTITDASAVHKSYPAFFEDYAKLGGKADVF